MKNSEGPRRDGLARFGNMYIKYSEPNELPQDVKIGSWRAARIARRSRIEFSTGATASMLPTDTSTTQSKKSSFQIAAFVINHPILAMLVLGLIALIGSICIFALPIGWLPF